jgi:hypothetical protein
MRSKFALHSPWFVSMVDGRNQATSSYAKCSLLKKSKPDFSCEAYSPIARSARTIDLIPTPQIALDMMVKFGIHAHCSESEAGQESLS